MGSTGRGVSGQVYTGRGSALPPSFQEIGTNSGLTNHGTVIAQGNDPFVATSPGSAGQVLTSNGPNADPTYQTFDTTFPWVDVSGSVNADSNYGYFVTGTCTSTLPSSPSQGDTIKYIVDHASQLLTIQASAGKVIRLGNTVTAAAGTAVSTLQGDAIELVYRSSDQAWLSLSSVGQWTLT